MPSVSPCRSSLFVQLRSRLWPQQGSCRQVVRWSQPFAGCSATPKQENEKQQRPDGRADGNDKIRFNASTLRRRFIKLSNFQTSNFRTFALSKHGRTAMYALHVHNLYTAAYNFLHHIPLQKHHHDHHQACITKGYDHTGMHCAAQINHHKSLYSLDNARYGCMFVDAKSPPMIPRSQRCKFNMQCKKCNGMTAQDTLGRRNVVSNWTCMR